MEADSDPDKLFLCSQARNNAIRKATTEIVIIADADTIPDQMGQVEEAVRMIADGEADMVYPFTAFLHIPEAAATMENYTLARVQARYTTDPPGGIFVTSKKFLDVVGWFDERFCPGELSFDDRAFKYACETFGRVERVNGHVWSFNHATALDGRPLRDYSPANKNYARFQKYVAARGNPDLMKELIQ